MAVLNVKHIRISQSRFRRIGREKIAAPKAGGELSFEVDLGGHLDIDTIKQCSEELMATR